jgi:Rrf2 family protein
MHLTRAAAYAVNALALLARDAGGRPATAADLSSGAGASRLFLSKVLGALSSAGLLRTVMGPHGGYRLARPASAVTLLEVVEAVEGPLDGRCAPPGSAHPAFDRRLEAECRRAAEAQRRRLGRVRLSDLAGGR